MYTSTIALAIAPLLLLARADVSLDRDDIPRACDAICNPIVDLTRACDTDLRGDRDREEDRLEAQCVCTNDSFNVARVAALCAGCIHQNAPRDNDDDDDDDRRDDTKDIDDILYTCGFSSTTYVASAASAAVSGVSVDATRPTDASQLTTTIIAGATGTRGSSDPSNTGSSGGNGGSGNSNNNNNDASATNSAASPDETNAAAAMAPVAFVGAAVGAAMLLV
ncbi:hypothetical protein FPSE_10009 [Fusarium pseudograminearum CS3096]|uniref:Protein CAP22 n=1 Tax=Fusarium pseudograminearum (strain CS3096) TaxID=1028729 RepID=K3V927_FUSPC|nr:hypothetical protein FPSE_10009 [Fusarium pseudograminearum CS3096]EKJ69809.1 hypothetical protein FPSE_10009 [Fusarium pseudograminearum CS3096]KAF0637334.1 hypothetical protein FPSE5266_10009 [Fusarium pseudograminearum]